MNEVTIPSAMKNRLEFAIFRACHTLQRHLGTLLQHSMRGLVNVADKMHGKHECFGPLLAITAEQLRSQAPKFANNAIAFGALGIVFAAVNGNVGKVPI